MDGDALFSASRIEVATQIDFPSRMGGATSLDGAPCSIQSWHSPVIPRFPRNIWNGVEPISLLWPPYIPSQRG